MVAKNDPKQASDEQLQGFNDTELALFNEDVRNQLKTAHTNWVGRINSWYLRRLIKQEQKEAINSEIKEILLKLYDHKNGEWVDNLKNVLYSIRPDIKVPTRTEFMILLFMNPSTYIKDTIKLAKSLNYNKTSEGKQEQIKLSRIENLEKNFWKHYVEPLEENRLVETTYEKPIKKMGTYEKKKSSKRVVLSYKLYKLIKFACDDLEKFSKPPEEVIMLKITDSKNKILLIKLPSYNPYQIAYGMWGFPTINIDKFSHQLKNENNFKNLCSEIQKKIKERFESVSKLTKSSSLPSSKVECYFPLGATSVAALLIEPSGDDSEFVKKFIDKVENMTNQEPHSSFIVEKYEEFDFFDYKDGVIKTVNNKSATKLYFRTLFYFTWQYALELLRVEKDMECKEILEKVKKHIDKDKLTKGQFELMIVNNWQFFTPELKGIFKVILGKQNIKLNV